MMGYNEGEDILVVMDILCEVTEVVDPGESVMVKYVYLSIFIVHMDS
jgi:hypothetical protein